MAKFIKLNAGPSVEIKPLSVAENGTFTAPDGQAYSPVDVAVAPTVEPITITENGVYPVPKGGGPLDFGKEVKFKEVITEEDFQAYMSSAEGYPYEDEGLTEYEIIMKSPTVVIMNAYDNGARNLQYFPDNINIATAGVYAYISNAELLNEMMGQEQITEGDGWYQMVVATNSFVKCSAPSMVIPEGATLAADLATTSIFFDIETKSLDGWGDITVNVAGEIVAPTIELVGSGGTSLVVTDTNTEGLVASYEVYADGVSVGTVAKAESIDIAALGITSGAAITVKAKAISEASNAVTYTTS